MVDSVLPVTRQAQLLSLSRSGLYYLPKPPSPEEVAIKRRIDEIYTERSFLGSRRMKVMLNWERYHLNRNRVQNYMQEMGIAGIHPGPNLSKALQGANRYPYLLRNLVITHPDHV